MTDEAALKRRYRFHSRRGMKEIEEILYAYLDHCFDDDDDEMKAMYGRLLECHDVELFDWFLRSSRPEDPELAAYVEQLVQRVEAR